MRYFLLASALMGLFCSPVRAVSLIRVKMVSPSAGWAVAAIPGRCVLCRTSDGGRHWANVSPPGFAEIATDFQNPGFEDSLGYALPNAHRGWVVAAKDLGTQGSQIHVWRTTDGGRHWRESHFPVRYADDSFHVQFLDDRHGVLLALGSPGAGLMAKEFFRTSDGGQTWQHMASPDHLGWSFYPSGMAFRTPMEGWIAASYHGGPDAPFLHTTDGGRSWHNQFLPLPTDRDDVYANTYPPLFFGHERRSGLFVSDIRNAKIGASLYETGDGGRHWRRGGALPGRQGDMSGSGALGISFADFRHGWTTDNAHGLFVTRNGGQTWRQMARRFGPTPPAGEEAWEWTQLDFIAPKTGWALFRRRTQDKLFSDLYQTQDGGRHWRHIQSDSLPQGRRPLLRKHR